MCLRDAKENRQTVLLLQVEKSLSIPECFRLSHNLLRRQLTLVMCHV